MGEPLILTKNFDLYLLRFSIQLGPCARKNEILHQFTKIGLWLQALVVAFVGVK